MIKLKNISKKFGKKLVLDSVNLEIKDCEKVLIVGQNGAGKSTLLKVILGELIPNNGDVLVNGFNPFNDRKNALKHLAFVPQLPPPLKLTLKEICYYAEVTSGVKMDEILRYTSYLHFDLKSEFKKPFYKLSGGMKQKFLISLALARNSSVLIFDEPTANLDKNSREVFLNLLKNEFLNKTIINISHRLDEVRNFTTSLIELDLGVIVKNERVI